MTNTPLTLGQRERGSMFGIKRLRTPRAPKPITIPQVDSLELTRMPGYFILRLSSDEAHDPDVDILLDPEQVPIFRRFFTTVGEELAQQEQPDRTAAGALGHTATCPDCLSRYFHQQLGHATPAEPVTLTSDMTRPLARALLERVRVYGTDPELIEQLSKLYVVMAAGLQHGTFYTRPVDEPDNGGLY